MVRKISKAAAMGVGDEKLDGMMEMRSYVLNLVNDISREYGIEKEKGN